MMTKMLDPEKKGSGEYFQSFLGKIAVVLQRWRCTTMWFFLFLTVLSLWAALVGFQQDTGVPKMFHPDHPREVMRQYEGCVKPIGAFCSGFCYSED